MQSFCRGASCAASHGLAAQALKACVGARGLVRSISNPVDQVQMAKLQRQNFAENPKTNA